MQKYEINMDTLAIIPINSSETKIIEKENEYIVSQSSLKIIDDGCRFFGSSYVGRSEGTKSLIGVNYKAPIIVEETTPMIFFQTLSPRLDACSWISFKDVEKCIKNAENTIILFKNGIKVELNTSYKIMQNQILRSSYLNSTLLSRKIA